MEIAHTVQQIMTGAYKPVSCMKLFGDVKPILYGEATWTTPTGTRQVVTKPKVHQPRMAVA